MSWCNPRGARACPTGLPELSHALNDPGDPMAAQFDQILNLSGIFAPLLPLDAALTFWAPLDYTLNDLRGAVPTFSRNTSATWRRDDGQYFLLPSNQPRFEALQLLMEPGAQNKNTNYNFEPDAAETGIGGTAERVSDMPTALAALGNGFSWEVDGTGGTVAVTFDGVPGNLNPHACSAWVKMITKTSSSPFLRIGTTGDILEFENTDWRRIVLKRAPGGVNDLFRMQCPTGSVARIVANQFEELAVETSPIITQGAAESRAVDALSYANADQFFNQVQGMALITMRPGFDKAELSTAENLLTVDSAAKANLIYYDTSFRSTDGTNEAAVLTPGYVTDDQMKIAVIYGPAGPGALQIGYSLNGAAWVWSGAVAYDGTFATDNVLGIVSVANMPVRVSNVQLYNENRGAAWVEENY